ncbi:hypothetical protein FIBSPDRAFT_948925 [Athelia psychrophila]|uniref:Uncharacterized protein n=1 Tax=Athelia psychrophila TaxID=1759441 RepID=A0A166QB07_9AGAM|nr:hypothetical protein FIBSPDRAFT_948925 [Fibularhizoctonia sp. CBS 109695]
MSTATVERWNAGVVVSTEFNHCLVGAYNFKFNDNLALPEGWAACTHPEAICLLMVVWPAQRVYTGVLMHDSATAAIVDKAASRILGQFRQDAIDQKAVLPMEVDLVLEITELGDRPVVRYYFADHVSRVLFWMEEFDAWRICCEVKCVVSLSHLRLEIESQYWAHYELFPNCRDYTTELRDEVRGIMLHAISDQITSSTSTALYTREEHSALLAVIEKLQVDYPPDRVCAGAIVGRAMRSLKHMHFMHLYGQHGARLDSCQSVHGVVVHPQSWYLQVIEPLLFWGAEVHLVSLEKIWVDRTMNINMWRRFVQNLQSQWRDLIIAAAILLNMNIVFLSIQSVDNHRFAVSNRSPTQILIYVSTITSLFSILFASFLLRYHKHQSECAGEIAAFLGNMTGRSTGLQNLAIMYAIPHALIVWSALEFSGSFLMYCFSNTTIPTRVTVTSTLGICIVLTVWCWVCLRIGGASRDLGCYSEIIRDWARCILKGMQPSTLRNRVTNLAELPREQQKEKQFTSV